MLPRDLRIRRSISGAEDATREHRHRGHGGHDGPRRGVKRNLTGHNRSLYADCMRIRNVLHKGLRRFRIHQTEIEIIDLDYEDYH
jgi:hypothetical protein